MQLSNPPSYFPSHFSRFDCYLRFILSSHIWFVKVIMESMGDAVDCRVAVLAAICII